MKITNTLPERRGGKMKKLLLALCFISLAVTAFAAPGNLYFNLKQWTPQNQSNVIHLGYYVYNYNTYTVKVSDVMIEGWINDAYSNTGWAFASYGSNVAIYNSSDVFQTNLGAFNVNFSNVSYQDCGTEFGINRRANIKYQISYTGSETIPANGGYMVCNSDTNTFAQIRRWDYTNVDETDDYSSTESSNLNTTRAGAIDYKYSVLKYSVDGGATYQHVCERTNTGGTVDTSSGLLPCNQDACGTATPTVTPTWTLTSTWTVTPTITETATPTITETVTPTVTMTNTDTPVYSPTFTLTITETWTDTATITETVTPTVTRTYTITPTITITPTYTVTPTITPGAVLHTNVQSKILHATVNNTDGSTTVTWDSPFAWDFLDMIYKVQLRQMPADAKVDISYGTSYNSIIVRIVDDAGDPVDCSGTNAILDLYIMTPLDPFK